MVISGTSLIAGGSVPATAKSFMAINPATAQSLPPEFSEAGALEVRQACDQAAAAFDLYRNVSLDLRARFLETIADNIEALGDELVQRASQETGLAPERLGTERTRTTGQLRLFADTVRNGFWLDARIDPAQPDRKPLPRADLRLRNIGVGPVAVFGSSNFPLAFSVAGGDTASALAAGCPVVVKAHPAHPGTSALVGQAVQAAVQSCGLPAGVFSLLFGAGTELGGMLVADPAIKAVGFTGSRGGGVALLKIAAARPEPIPVHAEMSSINPVILLPGALDSRAAAIAEGFVASLTMGAGQLCTNPGLLIAETGPGLDDFVAAVDAQLAKIPAATMLTSGIFQVYEHGTERLASCPSVTVEAQGGPSQGPNQGVAKLFSASAEAFLANRTLSDEMFGAASLLVRCRDREEMLHVLEGLDGQLTVALQMDDTDLPAARALLPLLERRAGRILANGWPTGVEVCQAMVHGGPFPATSDSRTTSVGTLAIRRFLRPVCYQNLPPALLPEALQDANPEQVPRMLDGHISLGTT